MQDSYTHTPRRHMWYFAAFLVLTLVACVAPGCGGGAGGEAAGRGLALLNFSLDGVDNAVLNQVLLFNFTGVVDPATISPASIQIREGPAFGASVEGIYVVTGSTVRFEPRLPTLCDLSDGAFKPNTQYRVQVIGFPEQFAVRNSAGQSLEFTETYEFHTRVESDPTKYADQVPGVGPSVQNTTPENGSEAVAVIAGNKIEIVLSENVNPCSVNDSTVLFHMHETGDVNIANTVTSPQSGNESGFYGGSGGTDTSDQAPLDHTTWGADVYTTFSPRQKILARIELSQTVDETKLVITPLAGWSPDPAQSAPVFPENALLVVELTFGITDFGNLPLTPHTFSFTTENLSQQSGQYILANDGETPYLDSATTADVDTSRAPSRVQGFMLFTGDGDNGVDELSPGLPQSNAPACSADYHVNDGTPDHFDPSSDVLLDTGSTPNLCPNSADGSYGVVWEFKSFTIRDGITVRIVGVNPAIFLVQGDISISSSGMLRVRGDGLGGSPQGKGGGNKNATTNAKTVGGTGVAGGGDGGSSHANNVTSRRVGLDGMQGYFHATPTGPLDPSVGLATGAGTGQGNTSAKWTAQTNPNNRNSPSGGGGGHASDGDPGQAKGSGSAPTAIDLPLEGEGGLEYGDDNGKMFTPEAGSGGGAGGEIRAFSGTAGRGPGGAGGAGGGFVDLTCGGDMIILGTIDAAGSRGGSNPGGNFTPNYSWQPGTGGGGGGSGGGIRLLTPNDMVFGASSVVTVAGGVGGAGGASQATDPGLNNGGSGADGRIALEDGDSIISGIASAAVTPAEGSAGFYRGVFDATRFQGGGLTPLATTDLFAVGPLNPVYVNPVQADFVAAIPVLGAPGIGSTGLLIEMRCYQMGADALPQPTSETDWFSVGYLKDTGIESLPQWNNGHPGDVPVQPDNALDPASPHGNSGSGMTAVNATAGPGNGFEFVQIRITVFLPSTIGVQDPGSMLDDWIIRFTADQ